jgi:negative regulator of flagellin synthesis FlgM
MKIESLGKPVAPVPTNEARPRPPAATPKSAGEKVQLSSLSATLQKAETALDEAPVVDRARVEEIKTAIREGRFRVDANRIADGLIESVRQMLGHGVESSDT